MTVTGFWYVITSADAAIFVSAGVLEILGFQLMSLLWKYYLNFRFLLVFTSPCILPAVLVSADDKSLSGSHMRG